MARIDNLTNNYSDIADAIRAKTGKTATIKPKDFDTEILSIESGGSGGGLEYLLRDSLPAGSKAILTQDGDGTLKAVIPDGVTSIGNTAFYYNQLKSLVIPDSVKSIGDDAFRYNQLTSVVIGNSVTNIDTYAFQYNQLKSLVIPDSVIYIGNCAFSDNELTSVDFGNGVTTIGQYAFNNNKLTSIVIPNSVTSIGVQSFTYNQLTSVVIPDSVTSIGNYAFRYNQLTEIIFESETPPTIQFGTFNNNPNLLTQGSIYVPNNSVEAYKEMTNYTQFASIIKPISERP